MLSEEGKSLGQMQSGQGAEEAERRWMWVGEPDVQHLEEGPWRACHGVGVGGRTKP